MKWSEIKILFYRCKNHNISYKRIKQPIKIIDAFLRIVRTSTSTLTYWANNEVKLLDFNSLSKFLSESQPFVIEGYEAMSRDPICRIQWIPSCVSPAWYQYFNPASSLRILSYIFE